INDDGIVVGEGRTAASLYGATEWKDGTAYHVPVGSDWSEWANGVNNAGLIVGAVLQPGNEYACVSDGVKTTLLPGDSAFAESINNTGEIAGTSDQRATIWKDGRIIPLNLSIPTEDTSAISINDRGDVAGSFEEGSLTHGFYYHDAKTSI